MGGSHHFERGHPNWGQCLPSILLRIMGDAGYFEKRATLWEFLWRRSLQVSLSDKLSAVKNNGSLTLLFAVHLLPFFNFGVVCKFEHSLIFSKYALNKGGHKSVVQSCVCVCGGIDTFSWSWSPKRVLFWATLSRKSHWLKTDILSQLWYSSPCWMLTRLLFLS